MTQDELKLVFDALKECTTYAFAGGLGLRATAHTDALAILDKALAQPEQEQDHTYAYASSLATAIWQEHYIKESPEFELDDTTMGVLTQIDSMSCGLVREKPAQPEQNIAALVEGMEVSIDVSTGEHDSGHRLFGVVTLVQENQGSKHNLILLVQEPKANFKEALAQPEPVALLPDGSAFGVMSFPLPDDHWLYAPNEYRDGEYEPIDLPNPILTHALRNEVVAAVRYAVRGATMRGQDKDFDPDALVQNAVYALCGAYTTAQPKAEKQEQEDSMEDDMKEMTGYKSLTNGESKMETSITDKGNHMNLNQGKLAQALVNKLLETIHEYDNTMYLSTAIGCLELVKQQLINDSMEDET